jgi:asparagine synthase (glutamine-hydrolysing)
VVRAKQHAAPADDNQVPAFDQLLERAVERQMVSDVPLGSFLSGGLDSSTIAYYASRHARGSLQTFSMGFAEKGFSELEFAEKVATHLGTEHRQATVRAKSFDELSDLVWYYDEPLGDTSIVPATIRTWPISSTASTHAFPAGCTAMRFCPRHA